METAPGTTSQFEQKYMLGIRLLENIKQRKNDLVQLHSTFRRLEPDFVYRFYHHSFKVFGATEIIELAINLFEQFAPSSAPLNPWFRAIVEKALSKSFDPERTNSIWLDETRPILEAYSHCKYFLEQMIEAAEQLDTAPQILPSGWAAVLILYDLR